jgi:hypothetical protein
VTVAWTTPELVAAAFGPSGPADDDPFLVDLVVPAANAAAWRKRHEAGYVDPDDDEAPAPSADVAMGTTLWAVALYRERASTESFASFTDLGSYTPTGSWGQIKRLLGIGRARTDGLADEDLVTLRARRRRRRLWP